MKEMDLYREKYPHRTMSILGHDFKYRYHENPNASATLVLLTGGIGLSDLFFLHYVEFSKHYSVITFDYHVDYQDINQTIQAIALLLERLEVKAYLVGQSLGGFVAQLIAKYYPHVVKGLILSNTGTLSVNLNQEGRACLSSMMDRQQKMLKVIKLLPFPLMKRLTKKAVMKKLTHWPEQETRFMNSLTDEMLVMLTKKYEIHMIKLLLDLQQHWNLTAKDFEQLQGRVLLILSEDDHTFNSSVKLELTDLMPEPEIVTDITGGHLALLLKLEKYAGSIQAFLDRVEQS